MDLRKQLFVAHNKSNCLVIVHWIGSNPTRFATLFDLFLSGEFLIAQRAAWPISETVIAHPELIKPYYARLLRNLDKSGNHESVKRNTIRLLEHVDIPKRYHGNILNRCFNYISDPGEKPAVKASSITVLDRLSQHYPEITNELLTILADRFDSESAAFRARARKLFARNKRKPK